MTTRRAFLTTSSLAAAATLGTPWRLGASGWSGHGLIDPPPRRGKHISDPDLKALAQKALDAATAGGASYADVRFTVTQHRYFKEKDTVKETASSAVVVRALVHGAWGSLIDSEFTPEMMEWLGRGAADLGKANAWPNRPSVELGERPPAAVGHWETPIKRDPFKITIEEYRDIMHALDEKVQDQHGLIRTEFDFKRQERTFASTDGSFTTQVIYTAFDQSILGGSSLVVGANGETTDSQGTFMVPGVSPMGAGFEVFEEQQMFDRLPEWVARAVDAAEGEELETPGQFEVVFDGHAMAALISTMGVALDVDRVLGYEANAAGGGTSYLSPIEKMLGTKQFRNEVTITADRMMERGAATVKWDDEGVAPQEFTLIKNGTLVDYSSSREFSTELAAAYRAKGLTMQGRGCSGSESALFPSVIQTPNLRLQPGPKDLSFDEMVAGMDDGIAIVGGNALYPDQQQLTAMGGENALFYRVKKGKLAGTIKNASYTMRIPDLWKNLVALGGERSAETRGIQLRKGEPEQAMVHSVRSVAGRFKNVVVRSAPDAYGPSMFGN